MPESSSPSAQLTWIHTDSRGVVPSEQAAYARAVAMQWTNDAAGVADQRALVSWQLLAAGALSDTPPLPSDNTVTLSKLTISSRSDNAAWQNGLLRALFVYLAPNPTAKYSLAAPLKIETENGDPPAVTSDAGFPWVAAIAIIVAGGVIASVLGDWLSQQNEIEATKVATDANVQKHAAAMAAAADIVTKHVDQEHATGKTLPWDDHELDLLHTLEASTTALAEWKAPELKSLPNPDKSIAAGVSDALRGVGGAASNAGTGVGFGVGAVVALVAGLWFLSESGRRHAA